MAESVCASILDIIRNELTICPLCLGIFYNPNLYDKLCSSCRKSFIWIEPLLES